MIHVGLHQTLQEEPRKKWGCLKRERKVWKKIGRRHNKMETEGEPGQHDDSDVNHGMQANKEDKQTLDSGEKMGATDADDTAPNGGECPF